ncbi:toll/interleukin-1 receptor domain-containing protein [Actinoplanes sp. HUAS TT8]|uniref:toll/interleukin-1 receptor domain-containing protein n=1 Tax=Actinoplanes sp. HUAS TT8 TaxID=3447453 RepID=UPI003F5231EB
MTTFNARCPMWNALRHAEDVPVLLSYTLADAVWAQWINRSLQAAGHAVEMAPAGVDFAHRLSIALSGPDPVIILVSAEHRGTASEWSRVPVTPTLTVLRLDAVPAPAALRAANCKSLHDLDEEEALEILMTVVDGPQNPFSRTS